MSLNFKICLNCYNVKSTCYSLQKPKAKGLWFPLGVCGVRCYKQKVGLMN